MNIFFLSFCPREAAQMQCDKHVVKMVLETAQLLCSVHYYRGQCSPEAVPYKLTHKNHPCSIWARKSVRNYEWLMQHFRALLDEYTLRYGKQHKCEGVYSWLVDNPPMLPDFGFTKPATAMPDEHKSSCIVESYRAYYKSAKAYMAVWNKQRQAPEWWVA